MCGIVGFLTSNPSKIPELKVLREMRDILIHRGPDDEGEYIQSLDEKGLFLFLGHRRLSIIDLFKGHQPISNEDETIWVIFNGEIYNFKQLRKDLERLGHWFKTDSDTEVIVHSYEEYGEDCFKYFNGMFAISIWNKNNQRLILSRDRFGKKPLYYYFFDDIFIFSSELKAIVIYPGFRRTVDPVSLSKYLFYEFIPSPKTIFKNVKKLPSASYLVLENGRIEIKRYWSPFENKEIRNISEQEVEERIVELLKKSVGRRLISDVPLGVFLSGGIDSSCVAAFAQKEVTGKVKTFSIGFEDPTFDESKYAILTSKFIETEHHQQVMYPKDLMEIIPFIPHLLDEPMADASIIPTFLLSKFTREYVTVALGGDGGDELFAGYPTYLAHKMANYYESIFGFIHPVIKSLGNLLPVSDNNFSFDFKVKKFLSGIGYPDGIRNSIWLGSFTFEEIKEIISKEIYSTFDSNEILEEIYSYEKDYPYQDEITKLQYLDLKLYLQESVLVKVDRASMACSLEVRAPFLDYEIVEFVMSIPSRLKLKNFTTKYILKKALKNFLPKEIIHRPKKGFGIPIAKWIKGPLKDLFQDLLNPEKIKREGFLNPDYVGNLLEEHLNNKKDNRKKLWTLLVWQLWTERYHPTI